MLLHTARPLFTARVAIVVGYTVGMLNLLFFSVMIYNLIRRRFCTQRIIPPPIRKPLPTDPARLAKLQAMLSCLPRVPLEFLTESECTICLEPFSSKDIPCKEHACVLPCGHAFHNDCLERWVQHKPQKGGSAFCPLCKRRLLQEDIEAPPTAAAVPAEPAGAADADAHAPRLV